MVVIVQPPCGAGSRDGGGLPRPAASPAANSGRPCWRQEATTVSSRSANRLPASLSEPLVFISYAHEDLDVARVIANGLQDEGCYPWLDDGELRVGDSLIERVTTAAHEAEFVVALVSGYSVASNWCQKELAIAMTGELAIRGVKVLPVMCDIKSV